MLSIICLLSAIAGAAVAQTARFGPCPTNIQPMQNFNANQFNGKWVNTWTSEQLYQFGTMCNDMTFGRANDGSYQIEVNEQNAVVPVKNTYTLYAVPMDQRQPGKLDVMIQKASSDNDVTKQIRQALGSGLMVLGTDYRSYAVTYYCTDFKLFHFNYVDVYSRQPGQGGVPLDFRFDDSAITDLFSSSNTANRNTYNAYNQNPYVRVQPYNTQGAYNTQGLGLPREPIPATVSPRHRIP